jgi:hypothetical protein
LVYLAKLDLSLAQLNPSLFFLLFLLLLLLPPLFKTTEGVVVGFQIFALAPKKE